MRRSSSILTTLALLLSLALGLPALAADGVPASDLDLTADSVQEPLLTPSEAPEADASDLLDLDDFMKTNRIEVCEAEVYCPSPDCGCLRYSTGQIRCMC